jgi:hypothetical protein
MKRFRTTSGSHGEIPVAFHEERIIFIDRAFFQLGQKRWKKSLFVTAQRPWLA